MKNKKILSVILAAILVLTCVPASVFAANNTAKGFMRTKPNDYAAKLTFADGSKTQFFKDADEAWTAANEKIKNKSVTMTLLTDWVTKELISFESRNKNAQLTIDLNNKTIKRDSQGTVKYFGGVMLFGLNLSGTFTVKNGTVTGGYEAQLGGGISVFHAADSIITLDNLDITGNKSADNGGGINIYQNVEKLTISNCKIHGNLCKNQGGGIYHWLTGKATERSTVILNNTSVTENMSVGDGGGMYLYSDDGEEWPLTLSGKVVITDNIAKNVDNLFINRKNFKPSAGSKILKVNDLSNQSKIKLAFQKGNTGLFTYKMSDSKATDLYDHKCFAADRFGEYVIRQGSQLGLGGKEKKPKATLTVTEKSGDIKEYKYESIAQAWADANNSNKYLNNTVVMTLFEDWIADGNKNLEFDIKGSHSGFANGRLWPQKRSHDNLLTLDLNNHKIDRHMGGEDRDYGNLISVEKDCHVIVKNGTLTGGHNDYDGGCILLSCQKSEKPILELKNVTITGNKSDDYGGGICFRGNKDGTLIITDCTITDNETDDHGGGIYAYSNQIKFKGKTIIKNNREKYWKFGYKKRAGNLYLSKNLGDPKIPYPELRNGAYIAFTQERNSTHYLTDWVSDTPDNQRQPNYFHMIDPGTSSSNKLWTETKNGKMAIKIK